MSAVITAISQSVSVAVELLVCEIWTEILAVRDTITITIRGQALDSTSLPLSISIAVKLVGVGGLRAVVTGIADSISIHILLFWIGT